jgi:hypothetical protein
MYTNIPTTEVKNIINSVLDQDPHIKQGIKYEQLNLSSIVLEQNYIQFKDQHYKQQDGLAMGHLR